MKNKQKPESITLVFPIVIDFADIGAVSKVVKKVMDKQPRKKRSRQSRVHFTLP